jgi:hypothetical protein
MIRLSSKTIRSYIFRHFLGFRIQTLSHVGRGLNLFPITIKLPRGVFWSEPIKEDIFQAILLLSRHLSLSIPPLGDAQTADMSLILNVQNSFNY